MDEDALKESIEGFVKEFPEIEALSDERKEEFKTKLTELLKETWEEGHDAGEEDAQNE